MTRIFILLIATMCCGTICGQPSWTKKAAKSVFTLKTFASDGTPIGEACGFFVGEGGEAVSAYAPFRGASRAIVVDAHGKEAEVASILGGNEMYDIAKFRVTAKRVTPLPIAKASAVAGSQLWLVPCAKQATAIAGQVRKTEKVYGDHDYYTLKMQPSQDATSCPLLNDEGEVVAMLQQGTSKADTTAYAVGVRFAADMKTTGLSLNEPAMKATKIRKELPDELDQAILTMYIAASATDSAGYVSLVDEFVQKFPSAPDGYVYRAQAEVGSCRFADAEKDMEMALKTADKKDEVHYSYAKLIYQKETAYPDMPYAPWSLDKAIAEADAAYAANPLPVYRQLKAQILFTQKKYADAHDIYLELSNTNLRSAAMFFSAARCKELLKDTAGTVALLDSAVNTFNKPYLKEAAPYILARAQAYLGTKEYRKAVLDFNEYEKLMPTGLNDNFYYIREQAELQGRLFQQALADISKAITLNPTNATYYAEKAMIETRVNMLDEAMKTSQECIKVAPELSDGYLFLGLAQCLKGNKAEGATNLEKAKQLGHEQAQELIDKYAK